MFAQIERERADKGLAQAVSTIFGLILSNLLQYNCSMSTWLSDGMISVFIQSSSIPMRADYAEANPLMKRLVGGLHYQLDRTLEVLSQFRSSFDFTGSAALGSATRPMLPDHSVDALITDPPYYFAIPYAELSDFFYVWLKRFLRPVHEDLFKTETTPKADEAIQNLRHSQAVGQKDRAHFETKIYESLLVGRNEVRPSGIAVVVFAHASTEGWESLLNALLRAGWIITGSWPIDTEREGRMLASRQRSLASSVHLVCRPRESTDGAVRTNEIGDWRDVLQELPRRIHEWMPRLATEGVVGADAIFACLGPALEIFSRYSHVEKASGEVVTLQEYLEYVWAAVAKEALTMIFTGADATGFEADARLSAMWLWTLSTAASNGNGASTPEDEELGEDEDDGAKAKNKVGGFVLEYDAARKIAQGLGAHLEKLASLVEVKGATARLLPVAERTRSLFQKGEAAEPIGRGRAKKKSAQLSLGFVADLEEAEATQEWGETGAPQKGETVLDRVHQSMILFGAGRGEALKRFLVEDGVGRDDRFWRLAQAFSALYPSSTDEKRWLDGVLARKKSLGF
jgi:putative DNA methylase